MRNADHVSNESLHLAWFVIVLVLIFGTYEIWVSHQAGKALQQFDQAIGQVQR